MNQKQNQNYREGQRQQFYHGYCKDQRDATVIILRYTTLRHNGLWEVIHVSPFETMWGNPCI